MLRHAPRLRPLLLLALPCACACGAGVTGTALSSDVAVVASPTDLGCEPRASGWSVTRPVIAGDGVAVLGASCGRTSEGERALHVFGAHEGAPAFAPLMTMPAAGVAAAGVPAQADSARAVDGTVVFASGAGVVYVAPGGTTVSSTPGANGAPTQSPTLANRLLPLGGAMLDALAALAPLADGTGRDAWTVELRAVGAPAPAPMLGATTDPADGETFGTLVADGATGAMALVTADAGGALCLRRFTGFAVLADGGLEASAARCVSLAPAADGLEAAGGPRVLRGPGNEVALVYAAVREENGPLEAGATALVVDDATAAAPSLVVRSLPLTADPGLQANPPALGAGGAEDAVLAEAGIVAYAAPGAVDAPGFVALTRAGLVPLSIPPACTVDGTPPAECTQPVAAVRWSDERLTLLYATPAGLLERTVGVGGPQ